MGKEPLGRKVAFPPQRLEIQMLFRQVVLDDLAGEVGPPPRRLARTLVRLAQVDDHGETQLAQALEVRVAGPVMVGRTVEPSAQQQPPAGGRIAAAVAKIVDAVEGEVTRHGVNLSAPPAPDEPPIPPP